MFTDWTPATLLQISTRVLLTFYRLEAKNPSSMRGLSTEGDGGQDRSAALAETDDAGRAFSCAESAENYLVAVYEKIAHFSAGETKRRFYLAESVDTG